MRKLLLCDDDATTLRIYRGFLRDEPYDLRTAQTGAEAIGAALAEDFSLVLMDIVMPDMSGVEAARRIRRLSPPRGTVPIIAVTGGNLSNIEQDCVTAGITGFLAKPLNKSVLLATIARHCRAEP